MSIDLQLIVVGVIVGAAVVIVVVKGIRRLRHDVDRGCANCGLRDSCKTNCDKTDTCRHR